MHVTESPDIETAYDNVGVYNQDLINGFSDQTLDYMLDLVNPAQSPNILDAMAGNGGKLPVVDDWQRFYQELNCSKAKR